MLTVGLDLVIGLTRLVVRAESLAWMLTVGLDLGLLVALLLRHCSSFGSSLRLVIGASIL
jgi:hypothetical protein